MTAMPQTKQQYFLHLNGEQVPASQENIRSWLAEGKIPRDTLSWKEGLADWVPLHSLPEFTAPPPIPKIIPPPNPKAAPRPAPLIADKKQISSGTLLKILLPIVISGACLGMYRANVFDEKSTPAQLSSSFPSSEPAKQSLSQKSVLLSGTYEGKNGDRYMVYIFADSKVIVRIVDPTAGVFDREHEYEVDGKEIKIEDFGWAPIMTLVDENTIEANGIRFIKK